MSDKDLNKISKNFCYILRHNPEYIKIDLDKEGYTDLNLFISQYNKYNKTHITRDIVDKIVKDDNKGRYTIYEGKIRCNQGHNKIVDVEVTMKVCEPPSKLYHGTGIESLEYIFNTGLKSMSRKFVHLSEDIKTASQVGKRHSSNYTILEIDSKRMFLDGYEFKLSDNKVWQIDYIPSSYITIRR